ncbi:GAF domain-containing protein [Streptomyces gardneri]|uniref:Transcriptional regulator n=1 Tax=Streptomyces gardneri TaxID=66892 RepID=A0A4Y3RI20_9ACTN|nr:GAF domain-containing protein [Streptomyces gardneri]ALO11695.1 putative transcriptional regulator [Streptomyces venezuelae]QPK48576.1 GAF domain-containing protein [Streptomyces gardneri]WRK40050.1 GAF domain-containing protein [Streptomyces venezuelae]CUM37758.1 Transcriptional regulator [Streptomyces venezuelae]GEB56333.1 transcriptional regulator [Streptomyces gardneri]
MKNTQLDMKRLAAMDAAQAARLLHRVRDETLAGRTPPIAPRAVIDASWQRMARLGLDPDQSTSSVLLQRDELEQRRRSTLLAEVMQTLSGGLAGIADTSLQIMVVTDEHGRVLWRQGNLAVLRQANGICLEEGAAWTEHATGTNAVGTALAMGRAVQVHSAEHYVHTLHNWTCAAAPVHDPRDQRLLGILDVSGPASSFHPAMLALVASVAQLAEAEMRERHRRSVERLRAVAAPILCRVGGRAVAVDIHGWTAAVTGLAPMDRIPLPKSFRAGRVWLPSLGLCAVEPLPGGWLLRVEEETRPVESGAAAASRVVLDLSRPRRWTVAVSGEAGSWQQELSPRHAELLYVLALHRDGRTAAELADDVFGDRTRTVTVRAEMSRVRRNLAGVLAHRPYRFREEVAVELLRPERPADLLPHSTAPAVRAARTATEA